MVSGVTLRPILRTARESSPVRETIRMPAWAPGRIHVFGDGFPVAAALTLGLRRMIRFTSALLGFLLALSPVTLSGTEEPDPGYGSALTLVYENDVFAAGSDGNYTNGLSAAITSAPVDSLGASNFFVKTANFFSFLPTVGNEGHENRVTYRLSHRTFTPPDITLPEPLPGDTPYSGVLLADVAIYSKTPKSQHTFLLAAGAAGPVTGAEYVQEVLHEWLDAPTPMGWDTQLGNEFLINLGYAYDYRLMSLGEPGGSGLDLSTGAAGALGNYITSAQGSLTLRFGHDLPDTYGELVLGPGVSSGFAQATPSDGWRIYGTLGASLEAVARFLPSDGNTFQDSLSGDRDDVFLSGTAGIVVGYRNIVLNFTYVAFFEDSDPLDPNGNDYGSIGFTWFF